MGVRSKGATALPRVYGPPAPPLPLKGNSLLRRFPVTQMTPSSVHAKYPATFTGPSDEESRVSRDGHRSTITYFGARPSSPRPIYENLPRTARSQIARGFPAQAPPTPHSQMGSPLRSGADCEVRGLLGQIARVSTRSSSSVHTPGISPGPADMWWPRSRPARRTTS